MPELPEVETIRRDLSKEIIGKTIAEVKVLSPKQVSPKDMVKRLNGLKVERLLRRAKLIIFELSDGNFLVIHLKLTGQLIYHEKNGGIKAVGGHPIKQDLSTLPNKFTRAIFTFSDGSHLFFNDLRKFGYLKYTNKNELEQIKNEYGIEPLCKEFTLEKFKRILAQRPKMKIKPLLMDQTFIAGLGNIYADEVCFSAGVRPPRLAGSLSGEEKKKMWRAIPWILKKAIDKRGISADMYVDAYGRKGGYLSSLAVYGRESEPCKKCGAKIVRLTLAGRGAHYCPRCQK